MKTIEDIASEHLGKAGDGSVVKPYITPDTSDPSLLVGIPRSLNRTAYNLTSDSFFGFDSWNAYEVSFLTQNGYPVNCVAKIVYPSTSECIVESKSLKLYLNSYNMQRMPSNRIPDSVRFARAKIEKDLTEVLGRGVEVFLHDATNSSAHTADPLRWYDYSLLEDECELSHMTFDASGADTDILQQTVIDTTYDNSYAMDVWTPSMRSNCRVTNQPDWGDVYIHILANENGHVPTHESLLEYIVSMRTENHFHEEICEALYAALMNKFNPAELMVTCLYTRRGGIDINPVRASHPFLLNMTSGLGNTMDLTTKTMRQ